MELSFFENFPKIIQNNIVDNVVKVCKIAFIVFGVL